MGLFIDIVSLIGSTASIAGVSLRDFRKKQPPPGDQKQVELFLRFLESREVLFAGMDDEVQAAVIRSLEEIKREAEAMRQRCQDEHVQTLLLNLLLTMSKQLQKQHGIDASTAQGQYSMYLALQSVRFELARVLAMLCGAFAIEPSNPRMKKFVLNFAVRPR
ncbi:MULTISPECIES: hypothetical protein [Comamonas]|nr:MULTISPECIES: hypothetical protein [Comamonas]KGG89845.1 hypothetical protein P369_14575 [Comamonas thiooxydans]KGG97215.1 hypothetical protein P367_16755 [Comamonas thiooxydans]KGH00402.1 hypothetical protein P365_20960 [Comamonas thiooxydans]KGH09851.1 hypothetical protein P368_17145 [Comamonas thiooxydans]TZG06343.1 hypothetical protein FZC30_23675 [Comamonas thiooxydans]